MAIWALGGGAEAEQSLQRIAAANPTFADVYAIWGVNLVRDGRWLDDVETNRKGAEITGGHPIFRSRQALGLRRAGRTAEAEALAADVRSGAVGDLSSDVRLTLALAMGDHEEAQLNLEQAIEERQPMVLWYYLDYLVADLLPREEPWVHAGFRRIRPEKPVAL